ncbi:hypothetical protein METHB2_550011 [Candidatus Methylobacter favarea]|uniref:Uncharacterized protein n=1 Tax=Candidatus Methylobacter favarea TaxID=2707345 RepID=A0A8S0XKD2_9GAMM|nr:hypothetical protein METHB2_550011 [Candidatus Methylobacter favarea]
MVKQEGTRGGKGELLAGQGRANAVDTGKGQRNELPATKGLAGLEPDGRDQQTVEQQDGENGSVPGHPGATNYDVMNNPNITLIPAKKRPDINRFLLPRYLKSP